MVTFVGETQELSLFKKVVSNLNHLSPRVIIHICASMLIICARDSPNQFDVLSQIHADFFDKFEVTGVVSANFSVMGLSLDYSALQRVFLGPIQHASSLRIVVSEVDGHPSLDFMFLGSDARCLISRHVQVERSNPLFTNQASLKWNLLTGGDRVLYDFTVPAKTLFNLFDRHGWGVVYLDVMSYCMRVTVGETKTLLPRWRANSPKIEGFHFMGSRIPSQTQVKLMLTLFNSDYARDVLQSAEIVCFWVSRYVTSVVFVYDSSVLLHYHTR